MRLIPVGMSCDVIHTAYVRSPDGSFPPEFEPRERLILARKPTPSFGHKDVCVGAAWCEDRAMSGSRDDERRLRVAVQAFDLIQSEVRPLLASGGRLWSKGSAAYPSRLRQMLRGLDVAHEVTFATQDAMQLPRHQRVVEHVIPVKRIIVEIVDPRQADPRSNTHDAPIAGGPATSPEHLISIFDRLLQKCWVTPEEHDRLNRAGRSLQWDAPDGDGWTRYRRAGVAAHRLTEVDARSRG